MGKSLQSDFSAPVKDIKLKFGRYPLLAIRHKLIECGQNY